MQSSVKSQHRRKNKKKLTTHASVHLINNILVFLKENVTLEFRALRSTEPVSLMLAKSRGFPQKLGDKEAVTLVNVRIQSLAFALSSKSRQSYLR